MTNPELSNFLALFGDIPFPLERVLKLHKSLYLVNSSAQHLIKNMSEEPVSVGLFLGTTKHPFTPSIPLLRIITPHTEKKITLNEKSAWLFVCGRDAFSDNILKGDTNSSLVIVLDENGETLGLAKKKPDMYKNIVHAGQFLKNKQ